MSETQKGVTQCDVSCAEKNSSRNGQIKDSVAGRAPGNGQPANADIPGKLHTPALNAGKSLETTQGINESIALKSARLIAIEKTAQAVMSVGSLCGLCATAIAQSLVAMQHGQDLESPRCLDSISERKRQILTRSLALIAGHLGNTGTTIPTTILTLWYGYVLRAIESGTKTEYQSQSGESHPTRFRYCSKASRAERNAGCEGLEERSGGSMDANVSDVMQLGGASLKGEPKPRQMTRNHHPTVKPLALMRYLCKLTKTPTGGIVLDPFMGSGTTGMGAVMEGREFIGVDLEAEYCDIAAARITWAKEQALLPLLELAEEPAPEPHQEPQQSTLFS